MLDPYRGISEPSDGWGKWMDQGIKALGSEPIFSLQMPPVFVNMNAYEKLRFLHISFTWRIKKKDEGGVFFLELQSLKGERFLYDSKEIIV